jgi:hypothetical protein
MAHCERRREKPVQGAAFCPKRDLSIRQPQTSKLSSRDNAVLPVPQRRNCMINRSGVLFAPTNA